MLLGGRVKSLYQENTLVAFYDSWNILWERGKQFTPKLMAYLLDGGCHRNENSDT